MASDSIFSNVFSEIDSQEALADEKEKVVHLALDMIDPDPGQPRKRFDEEKMQQLRASIAKMGVKQPIKVRGGQNGRLGENGRFVIVFGERRYQASRDAGLKTIPVVIDNDYQSIKDVRLEQIAENVVRADLVEEDTADFVIRMLSDGVTQLELSQSCGMSQARISHLNSMRNKPDFLEEAWKNDIVESASINAEIKRVWKKNKKAVEEWVRAQDEKISLSRIRAFERLLKEKQKLKKQMESGEEAQAESRPKSALSVLSNKSSPQEILENSVCEENSVETQSAETKNVKAVPVTKTLPKAGREKILERTEERISNPKIIVEFLGKRAILLTHRKVNSSGNAFIQYQQNGLEAEAPLAKLVIKEILES